MPGPLSRSHLVHNPFHWRTNLIVIPGFIVFAALLLFLLTQTLDHLDYSGAIRLPFWVNQGDSADCRDLVSATAGAIITTIGLILSITVLIFSTAATQFGQRLLRRFMRDRGTQFCIGIFAATFVFSLLTLLSVNSHADQKHFVPWVSAWTSLFMALSCVAVLIYFMHHVAMLIQVNSVLQSVVNDVFRVLDTLRSPRKRPLSSISPPALSSSSVSLTAPSSGYFQSIRHDELAEAARHSGLLVQFLVRPGHYVLQDAQIAIASPSHPNASLPTAPSFLQAFNHSVAFGPRRTMRQDPKFAILQIVEIGLRAMSPAVNDPFTMISCIDSLAASLKITLDSLPIDPVHLDSQGTPRIVDPPITFEKLAAAGFDPIRQICRDSVATTIRIFQAIASLAPFLQTNSQIEALERQADLTREGFTAALVSKDAADIQSAFTSAKSALAVSRSRLPH
jgi:uncharacterized membrane protein